MPLFGTITIEKSKIRIIFAQTRNCFSTVCYNLPVLFWPNQIFDPILVKLEGTIVYAWKKNTKNFGQKIIICTSQQFFCTETVWPITKQVWHIVMYLLRAQVWPWFFILFSDFFAIRDKRDTTYHTYPCAVDTLLYFQEMLKCNDLSCNYIALNVWGRDNNISWICCQ